MPSHTSAWGGNSPTQASHCVAFAMLLHVCTPCLHCPIEEPHACVAPRAQPHPSSISPSQLLSMPSAHLSTISGNEAPISMGLHVHCEVHTAAPRRHWPI